jgi:hypothetical protein
MNRLRRASFFAWLGLVVLASFVGAVVEASGPHTDDGCPVELHCRVCASSYASTAIVALPVMVGVGIDVVGELPLARCNLPADPRTFDITSRGPPRS